MNALLISLLVATLALTAVIAAPSDNSSSSSSEVSSSEDVANVTVPINFDEAMVTLLESFRKIMPCGDAALGIPVMAPYRIPKVKVNVSKELLDLKGEIENLVVLGINDFVIINLASNSSNNRTEFDVLYKGFQILGNFNIDVDADLAGFRFIQKLKGLINLQVLNVRVTGGMTVGVNEVGGMHFSDVEYYVQVGDIISDGLDTKWSVAVNNFVNQYARDASLLFLQTNREFLNKAISGYVTPLMNNAFYNISSSEYLLAIVEATELYNSIECSP